MVGFKAKQLIEVVKSLVEIVFAGEDRPGRGARVQLRERDFGYRQLRARSITPRLHYRDCPSRITIASSRAAA